MNNQNLNLIVSYWYRKDKFCLRHSGEFKQKKKSSKQKKKIFVSIKKHKKFLRVFLDQIELILTQRLGTSQNKSIIIKKIALVYDW